MRPAVLGPAEIAMLIVVAVVSVAVALVLVVEHGPAAGAAAQKAPGVAVTGSLP